MDFLLFEIGVFGYFCVSTEQCSALSDSVLIVLHLHPFVMGNNDLCSLWIAKTLCKIEIGWGYWIGGDLME